LNKTEKLPERQDKINLSDNTIYMFLSCLSGKIGFIYVSPQVFDHAVMKILTFQVKTIIRLHSGYPLKIFVLSIQIGVTP
jgi:hypothetical protein